MVLSLFEIGQGRGEGFATGERKSGEIPFQLSLKNLVPLLSRGHHQKISSHPSLAFFLLPSLSVASVCSVAKMHFRISPGEWALS